mmetsp:Transcript_23731/g.68628  ORF Transcript_23731/g.68628 Transcript_23731/m.68628 type:complete len:377 (+) Transcript_23731:612-1742(+)
MARMRPREHLRTHVLLEAVLLRFLVGDRIVLHRRVAASAPDVVEVWDVVARPISLVREHVRNVPAMGQARHGLRDPERAVPQVALAGLEPFVVHDHPLAVASPALVPQLVPCPLLACRGEAVRHHGAHPGERARGLHLAPERGVVVLNASLHHREPLVRLVPVVAAVQRAGHGGETDTARHRPRQGHVQILHDPEHDTVQVPRHMARPEVAVPRRDSDQRTAMAFLRLAGVVVPEVLIHHTPLQNHCGHQIVHVGIHYRLHEHLGLGGAREALLPAGVVVAVLEAAQLLEQEAHHAPVRIFRRVLPDLVSHPPQIQRGEVSRRRGHAPDLLVVEIDIPRVPLVLRHALARERALEEARGVALVGTAMPLGGVHIQH